jgi:RNA polymerase sigma-70 factor (ECF subfamily)
VNERHAERQDTPLRVAPAPLAQVDPRAEHSRILVTQLPLMRGFLFRLLGPRADLDDATQDALLALSEALPRLEDPARLASFAKTICVRVAYRYYGRRAPFEPLEAERHQAAEPLADEALAQRRLLLRLHRCLEKLPKKRRTAFVLCAVEGLSPHEAALLEGVSAGSMRARYLHAREELQRLLAATHAEEVHG